MSEVQVLASEWHEKFNRFAGDLYPGRYTPALCLELAEQAVEIRRLAAEKESRIVVHNYLLPEFHEIAHLIGDSLGLAQKLRASGAKRVDFEAVAFMGETAKVSLGGSARVFICDRPDVLGCSLVSGTDYAYLERWKRNNPGGVLVTYINSSVYAKSISDYIMTSGNAAKMIARAVIENPGKRVLVLPDKFLGWVMRSIVFDPNPKDGPPLLPEHLREAAAENIEVYAHAYGTGNASCYVHEEIGDEGPELALERYPDAELLVHPECGCANSCRFKASQGLLPADRIYFLSTEQMVQHARTSECREFVVATELGLIYRLRQEMPDKIFHPVSQRACCKYMKAATFPKLLRSLREDRVEIVFCDDCCDPKKPYVDDRVAHIPRSTANLANLAIERMFV